MSLTNKTDDHLSDSDQEIADKIIVLEGIDGCGKTTLARKLVEVITASGNQAYLSREPGSTPAGERIRSILLDDTFELTPEAQVLLFSASRANAVETIKRHARNGVYCILDRWYYSTIAYQVPQMCDVDNAGGCRAIIDKIISLEQTWARLPLCYNQVLFFDIDPEDAAKRIRGRDLDRFEKMGGSKAIEEMSRRRHIYRQLWAADKMQRVGITAENSTGVIIHKIVSRVPYHLASILTNGLYNLPDESGDGA